MANSQSIGSAITGPNIPLFRAHVIRQAIRFYLLHGRPINTAYTPRNMLAAVTRITGGWKYPTSRSGMMTALADLTTWIEEQTP